MKGLSEKFEKLMLAITFAESGEHETARKFLEEDAGPDHRLRPELTKRPRKEYRSSPPPR
jgi:hypothetical protein